jgi:hypothetical protein
MKWRLPKQRSLSDRFLLTSVVFGLVMSILFAALPGQVRASDQAPTAIVTVCIYDLNPQTQTAQVSFLLTIDQNSSSPTIVAQVNGPTQVFVMHLTSTGGLVNNQMQYSNQSNVIEWPSPGRPQDYPFDSYTILLSVQDNSISFPNGTVGTYAALASVKVEFCGESSSTLQNTWHVQGSGATISQSASPKPSHDQASIVIAKNDQWGLLVMLPIWMALIFVGGAFLLEPTKLTDRLTVVTALFVFAPIYLFSIVSQSPPSPIFNIAETQLVFLISITMLLGISTMVSSLARSPKLHFFSDGVALMISEVLYVALNIPFIMSLPSTSTTNYYMIGLTCWASLSGAAIVGRGYLRRQVLGIRYSGRNFLLQIPLVILPVTAGLIFAGLGVLLALVNLIEGLIWFASGIVLFLVGMHFRREIKPEADDLWFAP